MMIEKKEILPASAGRISFFSQFSSVSMESLARTVTIRS